MNSSPIADKSIEISDLSFGYDQNHVIRHINMDVQPGTLIALIGPNGSGKTTLLKLLAGLLNFNQGRIKINGSELNKLSPNARAKIVSFTPSQVDFPFDFSVWDAVSQGRSPYLDVLGNLQEQDLKITRDSMQRMSLSGYEDRDVNQLSQGERERVVIARHLAQDAPVMLFDESLAHLDLKHRLILMNELKKLVSQSKTIIIAIHEIEFAARYFPSVILMNDGVIVSMGKREDVIKEEILMDAYQLNFRIVNRENPDEISIFPHSLESNSS
jgi:iron complex transport system ATP-binding protein